MVFFARSRSSPNERDYVEFEGKRYTWCKMGEIAALRKYMSVHLLSLLRLKNDFRGWRYRKSPLPVGRRKVAHREQHPSNSARHIFWMYVPLNRCAKNWAFGIPKLVYYIPPILRATYFGCMSHSIVARSVGRLAHLN